MTTSSPEQENESSEGSLLGALLPYLVVTALVSAMLVLGIVKMTSHKNGSMQAVVFDVVKLANSQRAVASSMMKNDEKAAETAVMLLDISKRTKESIRKIAGAGVLVLVKQGVVSTDLPDITDDVLKDLGLPTKVPTQDTMSYLSDIAPTSLSMMGKRGERNLSGAGGAGSAANNSVLP